jgi:hypothetical protein
VAFFVAFDFLDFVAFDFLDFVAFGFVDFFAFDFGFVDVFDFVAFFEFFGFGVDFFDFGVDFFDFVAFFDLFVAPNSTHISSISLSVGFVLSGCRLFPFLCRSMGGLWALTFDRLARLDFAPAPVGIFLETLEALLFGGILFFIEKGKKKKRGRS